MKDTGTRIMRIVHCKRELKKISVLKKFSATGSPSLTYLLFYTCLSYRVAGGTSARVGASSISILRDVGEMLWWNVKARSTKIFNERLAIEPWDDLYAFTQRVLSRVFFVV